MNKNGFEAIGEYRGYEYGIAINDHLGIRCGYVTVNEFKGRSYEDMDIECHGGLTFSGELYGKFRIGFDCGHVGDGQDINLMVEPYKTSKVELNKFFEDKGEVRSKEFVIEECKKIIDQIIEGANYENNIK